ncbi:MAG: hypothetical protein SGI73_18185 [Chloroflexota bacterium]|nr:hypothetical protein [Chloroflexota bacterium]
MRRAVFVLWCALWMGVGGVRAQSEISDTLTPTVDVDTTPSATAPAISLTPSMTLTPSRTLTPSDTPSPTNDGIVTLQPSRTPTLTPTREGDILIYQEVEVIFPQAIRFIIAITPPLFEIESARLTVMFEGREPETVAVDLETAAFVGDPYSALNYFWDFTTETVPPVFSTLRYAWDVRASDDRYTQVEGVHTFQDERLIWARVGDDAIQMAIGASDPTPVGVFGLIRQAFDGLERVTGETRRYNWLIYDGIAPGCARGDSGLPVASNRRGDLSIPCNPAVALQVYNGQGYDVLRRPPELALDDALIEYMTRDFFASAWSVSRPPQWFINGMAQFFRVNQKDDQLVIGRTAADSNALFTLDALRTAPPNDPERRRVWRAQSYGIILYLLNRIGVESLYALALTDAPFETALEAALGEPTDALVIAWSGWLNTSAADSAYGVNPYIPPTLMPSSTPTPSPTWTVTPSPTPTATLSPTVTGYLSLTPRPTNTPSDTPDAPTLTPSVTPRSPGSLPTVTPLPPPTVAGALAEPSVQSAVLIGLIGILILLVIAVWRVGNKS